MLLIMTICTAIQLEGHWRTISHVSDSLVRKWVLESIGSSKQVVTRFTFEITELSNCTFVVLNEFLKSISGLKQEYFGDLDDSFELENLQDDILENAPTHENVPSSSGQEPLFKRFKRVSDNDISHLKAQNSERSTERQTK